MDWKTFGVIEGQKAHRFTFETKDTVVSISDYGATLVDWIDKTVQRNLVLGYESVEAYHSQGGHVGATVGPVANRIAGAAYDWNGTVKRLEANQGPNSLHSGKANIGHVLWHTIALEGNLVDETISEDTAWTALQDSLVRYGDEQWKLEHGHLMNAWNSPHRPEDTRMPKGVWGIISRSETSGFPSDVYVYMALYMEGTTVDLVYYYISMYDTFVNLTNHSYFNLLGTGDVRSHTVQIPSSQYMPYGEHQIVQLDGASVEGTPFDFRESQVLGTMLDRWESELAPYKGYDHDYVVEEKGLALLGTFSVPDLALDFYSDSPHMQLYTGNWLDAEGRHGESYHQWSGMCIEPQFVPNDINMEGYGESRVAACEWYSRTIRYVVRHI